MKYIFVFEIVFILVFLSGIIAFVGNYIGKFFGKRRLSVFNLRPRYTATLFTVLSGIIIMLLTFSTLIFISKDVRVALFGLETLKNSIEISKKELQTAKNEILVYSKDLENLKKNLNEVQNEKKHLEELKNKLKNEIEEQKSRTVVFNAEELIFIGIIKGAQSKDYSEKQIKNILDQIDADVKKYMIKDIEVSKSEFDSTVSYLVNTNADVVLKVISLKNVVIGGDLPVRIEVSGNKIVYKEGDEIIRVDISGKLSQSEIEQKLKNLIETARFSAEKKGVFHDVKGSYGVLPYSEIFDTARKIKSFGVLAKVSIIAEQDIYSIGPLKIKFNVGL